MRNLGLGVAIFVISGFVSADRINNFFDDGCDMVSSGLFFDGPNDGNYLGWFIYASLINDKTLLYLSNIGIDVNSGF